jgi:hypothetical protein
MTEQDLHMCWYCDRTFTELIDLIAHREEKHV